MYRLLFRAVSVDTLRSPFLASTGRFSSRSLGMELDKMSTKENGVIKILKYFLANDHEYLYKKHDFNGKILHTHERITSKAKIRVAMMPKIEAKTQLNSKPDVAAFSFFDAKQKIENELMMQYLGDDARKENRKTEKIFISIEEKGSLPLHMKCKLVTDEDADEMTFVLDDFGQDGVLDYFSIAQDTDLRYKMDIPKRDLENVKKMIEENGINIANFLQAIAPPHIKDLLEILREHYNRMEEKDRRLVDERMSQDLKMNS